MVAKKNVLIVEDEAQLVEMWKLFIEESGLQDLLQVSYAKSVAEAYSALEGFATRLDLVVMDHNVEGGDTLELVKNLRVNDSALHMIATGSKEMDLQLAAMGDSEFTHSCAKHEVVKVMFEILELSA